MEEEYKESALKVLHSIIEGRGIEDFSFEGSEVLLEEFYHKFGYSFPDHADPRCTGFFSVHPDHDDHARIMFFACEHFEGTNIESIKSLSIFMQHLKRILEKNGFIGVETHVSILNCAEERLILQIYYHLKK